MHYSSLVTVYQALEGTTKRLAKTHILAEFLKTVSEQDLESVLLLLTGKVFPPWDKRQLGVSTSLIVKAISLAAGETERKVTDAWKREGDLGIVAAALVGKKKQATLAQQELTIGEVITKLQKLPGMEGSGSMQQKIKSIASLLSSASGEEARFLARTILEELRVGVAAGTLRDALVWAYLKPPITYVKEKEDILVEDEAAREKYKELQELVQGAYDRANDFGVVAAAAKGGVATLKLIKLELGTPIRVMLAQKEPSIAAGMERVGRPSALEYKFDGFRLQCHKEGERVTLFTRRLENVTVQFPEIVQYVREHVQAKRAVLDAEAVGFDPKTGKYLPFQHVSQRIRRKYEIEKLAEKLPIELNLFDILSVDGKTLLDTPFEERRQMLERVLPKNVPRKIKLSDFLKTSDEQEGERFYKEALAAGNEGVMCKALDGKYKPGSRVGHMVKVKPVMESMDLIVVGGEWGEGKRSGWITSFNLACLGDDGEVLTIGKVGTGVKELEQEEGVTFQQLTDALKPHITAESGREITVHPTLVLEIAFEEIQQSPSYSSGYALRFPRVIRVREDRGMEDITRLEEVHHAFEQQR